MIETMRSGRFLFRGTILVTGILVLAVLAAGVGVSRQVSRETQPSDGVRLKDEFRRMSSRVAEFEDQWEQALRSRAEVLLERWTDGSPAGVRGLSAAVLLDPDRDHGERGVLNWGEVARVPVLGKFAGEDRDWVYPDSIVAGEGFREEAGRPPVFLLGRDGRAVALVLDPSIAAQVVVAGWGGEGPAPERGALRWAGPGEQEIARAGEVPDRPADDRIRHVSVFGDWTVSEWFPVVETVHYRTPVLAGSLALAALVALGGGALAWSQRKALRLASQQVSFVNRVSHELRTPLTNLLLNTDLALDSLAPGDERVRRRLGLIREETGRLSRITDNVLAFAREGRTPVAPGGCELSPVLSRVAEAFRPLFERRGIVCEIDCPAGLRTTAGGDSVAQILSNLLSNAEKYAGDGAGVRVSASGGERLVVEVRDDGPGIPRSFRSRAFTPFERAGRAVDEGVSGTGLGLAISRQLAKEAGGSLVLLDTDRGTGLRLTLPIGRGEGT